MKELSLDDIRTRGALLIAAGLTKTEAAEQIGVSRRRLADALDPSRHEARLERSRSPSPGMTRVYKIKAQ